MVVEDEATVRRLDPDFRRLTGKGDILTIVTAPGSDTDIVSRVFACGAGIDSMIWSKSGIRAYRTVIDEHRANAMISPSYISTL